MVNITVLMFFWWCNHIFWWLNHNVWWWHILLVVERPNFWRWNLYFSWFNKHIFHGQISHFWCFHQHFGCHQVRELLVIFSRNHPGSRRSPTRRSHSNRRSAHNTWAVGVPVAVPDGRMGARGTCGAVVGVFFQTGLEFTWIFGKSDRKAICLECWKGFGHSRQLICQTCSHFCWPDICRRCPCIAGCVEKNMAERSHRSHLHRHWGCSGYRTGPWGSTTVHDGPCTLSILSFSVRWFGTFFIFPNSWDDDPTWLIFIRGIETTNQSVFCSSLWSSSRCIDTLGGGFGKLQSHMGFQ